VPFLHCSPVTADDTKEQATAGTSSSTTKGNSRDAKQRRKQQRKARKRHELWVDRYSPRTYIELLSDEVTHVDHYCALQFT